MTQREKMLFYRLSVWKMHALGDGLLTGFIGVLAYA